MHPVLMPAYERVRADQEIGAAMRRAAAALPPATYLIVTRAPAGLWIVTAGAVADNANAITRSGRDLAEVLDRLVAAIERGRS